MKRAYLMELTIFRDYVRQLMALGFFVAIFVCAGMGTIVAAPAILTMMFFLMGTMVAATYDEQSNWGLFRLTMPLSRRDIVLARYGVIATLGLAGLAAGSLACAVLVGLSGEVELPFGLSDAIALDQEMLLSSILATSFCLAMGALIAAIETPIFFTFGHTKATQWLPMITVLLLFVAPMLIVNGTGILDGGTLSMEAFTQLLGFLETPAGVAAFCGIAVVFAAAVLGISSAVSLKLYERREL